MTPRKYPWGPWEFSIRANHAVCSLLPSTFWWEWNRIQMQVQPGRVDQVPHVRTSRLQISLSMWAGDSCCSLGRGEPRSLVLTHCTHNQDPLDWDWPSVFFPGHCPPASDFRYAPHVPFSRGNQSWVKERKLGRLHQQVYNFKGQQKIVLSVEFGERAMTSGQGVIKKGLVAWDVMLIHVCRKQTLAEIPTYQLS